MKLWLRPLGFGGKVKRQPKHKRRRRRSAKEGQMAFLDGSPHVWFGNEMTTLILSTDDATGKPLYGLPSSFYLDRASHFTTTRYGGIHINQKDDKPTHFERAIFADSLKARGRTERTNGIFHNRLVAELKLHNITDMDRATTYLNEIFIPKYTRLFGHEPEDKVSVLRKIPDYLNINNILCRIYERKVKNDNTFSVNGQIMVAFTYRDKKTFCKGICYY